MFSAIDPRLITGPVPVGAIEHVGVKLTLRNLYRGND